MAEKTAVICRADGCSNSTKSRDGYCCDTCKQEGTYNRRHKKGDPFYWSTPWLRFAKWRKRKEPLCQKCKRDGRLVPTDVVDHIKEIKDGGDRLTEENTECLCHSCHAKKTANEKKKREGGLQSPPTPPAQPFGSQKLPGAKLGGGGIRVGGNYVKR